MPETRNDPLQSAAAATYRRIDRDLRRSPEAIRPMLRVIRSNLFELGLDVGRIRVLLGLARPEGAAPAAVYVVLEDRATGREYRSNSISTTP